MKMFKLHLNFLFEQAAFEPCKAIIKPRFTENVMHELEAKFDNFHNILYENFGETIDF